MPVTRKAYWSADLEPELIDLSVGEVLAQNASSAGDRDAVLWEQDAQLHRLTWGEVYAAAVRGAARLREHTRPGDRIAVWAPNSVGWYLLEFASALAGTVLAPLNPALLDDECEYLLRSAEAVVLFTVPESAGKPLLARGEELARGLPRLREVIDLDDWSAGVLAAAPDPAAAPLPTVTPESPFLAQFTSGTTGRPKGAVISHRAAFNSAWLSALRQQPAEDEVWCIPLPLHHVGGSVSAVLGALSTQGAYVVVARPSPADLLRILARSRATYTGFVPILMQRMIDHPDFERTDLSALRRMMGGGTSVPSSLIQRIEKLLDVTILIGYGQSESVSISQTWLDDPAEVKARTIGRPLPQREVSIQRLESRRPDGTSEIADLGEIGEICTRSDLTMTEYLNGAEANAEVFDADGWLHTGDLAAMDETGVMTLHGRAREVIIRGGENIYPREIEEALLGHPRIAQVAVVGMPDPAWGEKVAAFVRLTPGADLSSDDLHSYARTVLAPFKVPVVWRLVENFPLTASQKIRKNVLRENLVALADSNLES